MGKLFKYEWRKQLTSKIVIASALVALIVAFLIGSALDKESWIGTSMVLMLVVGVFAVIYVGLESLIVLERDLRTKESYMLFMVPHSAWSVLGAKILASICQILLTGALFFATFFICFTGYLAVNRELGQMMELLTDFLEEMIDLELSWSQAALMVAVGFVSWIETIAVGFLSLIAARTVLLKSKLANLLAVALFILLNFVINKLLEFLQELPGVGDQWFRLGLTVAVAAVISAALLAASGWMAEKKLSV